MLLVNSVASVRERLGKLTGSTIIIWSGLPAATMNTVSRFPLFVIGNPSFLILALNICGSYVSGKNNVIKTAPPINIAGIQNVHLQVLSVKILALIIGPASALQTNVTTNRTANIVPIFSRLRSHISLRIPTPTVNEGPEKSPANSRALPRTAWDWENPPTIVKARDKGMEIRYMMRRPKISQPAVPRRAPMARP